MRSEVNRRAFLGQSLGAMVASSLVASSAALAGVPRNSFESFDETYDVVIIGSGFAGMACALKAGRAGLNVLLIEKMSVVGGNSAICGGNVACPNNPVQKALGIVDSKELFIQDCLKDGLGLNYTNLLGVIADRCNDTIEFVKACGAEFVPNKMLFEAGHSVPRSYEIKAGTGSGYIQPMYARIKELPNVKVATRTKFDDFVMDGDKVVGIVCRQGYRFNTKSQNDDLDNRTGHVKRIQAKVGVMLAAGGFSRDLWFRQVQDPRVVPTVDSTNQPGATAGVLTHALGIGAAPVQLCWLQFLPYCNPREKGFGVSVNFTNHACYDLGIVVNRETGLRFMDEHAGRKIKSDAIMEVMRGKPDNYPIAIANEAIVKSVNPAFIKLPLEMGTVKKFNTLEELAQYFKVPVQPLVEQVKRFNQYAKTGNDLEFHRNLKFNQGLTLESGPYYGIEVCTKIHHTMGGVMINEKAQVISTKTHAPIEGLFAGGEITGGVHGASRLGTVAVIDCLTFGMVAGESLVAKAKGKL